MIYDRRKEPEYNNNQRSDSSLFDDRRRYSNPRNSQPRPTPRYSDDFLKELERQEEQRYLNSLSTFELDLEPETATTEAKTDKTEADKAETEKKPEPEANRANTPRKSLFPNVLKPPTLQSQKANNQPQAKSSSNNSNQSRQTDSPTAKTPNNSPDKAPIEINNSLSNKPTIPQIPLNSTSPDNSETTTTNPQITAPTPTAIFIAPDLATARESNPQTILGKTQTGAILYTSDNPSSTLATAQEKDLNINQLSTSNTNAFYTQQNTQAAEALTSISFQATTSKQNIQTQSQNRLTQLDETINNISSSLTEIVTQQKQALTQVMNQSRNNIISATNTHINNLRNQNNQAIAAIDKKAKITEKVLSQKRYSALNRMATNKNYHAQQINQNIDETSVFFQRKENNCFEVVDFMEKTLARKYSKEDPPIAVFPQVQNLEASDRAIYVANWRHAKVAAATKTAAGLRAKIPPMFAQHNQKLQSYRTTAIEGGKQLADIKQNIIDQQYQATIAQIQQTSAAAKARTQEILDRAIAIAKEQEQARLNQIDHQQTEYLQQLDNQAHLGKTSLTQLGIQVKTGLTTHHQNLSQNFNHSVERLQNQLNPNGDIQALARVTSSAESIKQQITQSEKITAWEITNSTNGAISQLTNAKEQINNGLGEIITQARTQSTEQLNQYRDQQETSIDQTCHTYSNVVNSVAEDLDNLVESNTPQWTEIQQEFTQESYGVINKLDEILETAKAQVDKQQNAFERIPSREIQKNAAAAAQRVQPTWKKFLKVGINVLITVGVTVAIGALALSGVGLLAGLGLSALIGAAGGVAKLAANDIIDDKSSEVKDYLKAAAFGAATGVLEFAGGRIIKGLTGEAQKQMLLKMEKTVLSTITETVTNTTTELLQMWSQGEQINNKTIGIAALSALLSTAGGKYIDVKFGDIAEGAAKGLKKEAAQFATETAFDTGVETGASVLRGEEITAESMLTNLGAGVMGRGVAGRVDKLYGQKIRDLGTPQSKLKSLKKQDELGKTASGNSANKVEVYTDPNLAGNTVKVDYKLNDDGTITGIAMRTAPDATANDIELHQHTARVMRRYGGVLGRIRVAEAKIAKILKIKGHPRPGSLAWEAQHEIYKLEQISYDLAERIRDAEPVEASQLEAQLINIQYQLQEHIQTFKQEDDSDGVGYVAAEGPSNLHNHYNGKLYPDKYLSTNNTYGKYGNKYLTENDYVGAVQHFYDLLLNKDTPTKETDENGNTLKGKNNQDILTVAGYAQQGGRPDIFQELLINKGILDEKGKLINDPQKAQEIIFELLSATGNIPYDSVYGFRRYLPTDNFEYAKAVAKDMDAQGIEREEFQGSTPNIPKQEQQFLFATDKGQAWFLGLKQGRDRLATTKTSELAKVDRKEIAKLGKRRNIGIDFAGAETERFTDKGMERWQYYYEGIDAKAIETEGVYVYRTHVAEGYPILDKKGNVTPDSPHVEIANQNAGKIVDTLVKMDREGSFTENVVVRLGHMTHADFEQLSKLDPISKKYGVVVEANLTSNLVTRTLDNPDDRDRLLLKFLYQDNLRVTLNTDGDGVMGTTIEREYEISQEAIDRFKSGKLTLIDEKGKTIYYYDKDQVPDIDEIPRNLRKYEHLAIPESKQKNYNIDRLRAESDRYIDDIAPTLGSKQQRAENLKSIAWFKTEKTRVLSDCFQQGNCRITTKGKDARAIEREYELAETAINDFKSGKFPLVDEKNKKIYYYKQEQIPDIESRDGDYSYEVIPESKKDNFYIERPQEKN